ncbi:Cysteine-rich receptor-like protein kinase 25, partial [Mucuna pruriens]
MGIETKNFMTPLRIGLSFMFLVLTTITAQAPISNFSFCDNSTHISTSYKTNVKNLLSWATSDSFASKGYNYTVISNKDDTNNVGDAVYGMYNCRYDITGYFCQLCLSIAASEIARGCPNSVTAITWYDVCILRYSNQSFIGEVSLSPTWNVTGPGIIKDSTEVEKAENSMEGLIRKASVEMKQFWAVGEFDWSDNEKRYGWVQCDRDLTSDKCGQCLHALLDIFPQCCGTKVHWAIFAPTCWIRLDDEKFYQNSGDEGTSKSRKLIISLSAVGLVVVAILCVSIYCFWYRNRVKKDEMMLNEESLNGDLPTIPLITILHSTNNFSEASKLGEGGFGPVYKGTLPDGRKIAVKRLSQASGQGSEEFKNEVMFIAKLQHRNLVRLLASCLEENEKILVYEYMSNSGLDSHLFDDEKKKQLDWKLRLSIVNGIARGILYLHEDSRLRVIHRDVKASNVLLDDEMNPKISDFGLARAFLIGQNQANTNRIMGTYGYMAPEYAMQGLFSVKSDVFSFGVLVLEIVSGKKNSGFHLSEHGQSLLLYAWNIWCAEKCLELMDPVLEISFIASEVVKCIHIGLLCVQQHAADRPTMSTVVLMLGSDTMTLPKPNHPAFSVGRMTSNEASTSGSSKNLSINDVTVSTILPRALITKAQVQPTYQGSNCQNTTQQPLSSAYQTNLERIFTWASSDAATSKGYNHTIIGNNTPVYGLYDCRADLVGTFCEFCVSTAAREAPQRCPNRVSAMVWYDYCILRYSNESFFGTVLTNPTWHTLGTKNISHMDEIQKGKDFVTSLIRKATVETDQLYYMDAFNLSSTQRRYGMVLTNEGCRQGLEAIALITKAQVQPTYVGSYCQNTTQQPLSSAYQTNLERIFTWASSDAATSKGYNYTSIGNNTPVYGLYNCRADVVGYFCQFCVSTAAREAPQRCPNRVSAMVWYDYCILRYSNESFFGTVLTNPTWQILGTKNISHMDEIQKSEDFVTSLIKKATVETNQLYYMDAFNLSSTQRRYAMVQCSRDLTNEGCNECLEAMLAQVLKCCGQKIGWFIWSGTCFIRYDDQMVYLLNKQTSTIPVPNPQTAKHGSNKRSKILISVMGSITLLCFSVYCFWHRRARKDGLRLFSCHKIQTDETWNTELPIIPLITILQSTDNFSETSKLGEGGFGPVYKGILPDGKQIAVKRLSNFSSQGTEEFNNEVMFIAKLQHRNLVRLLACCSEENEKILVYEYLPNKSLDFHLFVLLHILFRCSNLLSVLVLSDDERRKQFDWKLRLRMMNGIARGILYLHEDSRLRLIHRDLKASNVLLDHDMNPKISDFGLARTFEIGQNHEKTKRVIGTHGYMAPEYVMQGLFSVKSDVFSFGVLCLEIICGRKNSEFYRSEHGQTLLLYAWRIWCAGKCLELMDTVLEKSFIGGEVERCIHIGLLCVQEDATDRPTMSDVVVMLASDTMALPKPKHPAFSIGRMDSEEVPSSKSFKSLSINDVTVSITLPR